MRRLIVVGLGLVSVFVLQIGASRLIGASKNEFTFAAFLRRDAAIHHGIWCWREICPGKTTIAEAKAAMLPLGGNVGLDEPNVVSIEYPEGYSILMYNNEGKTGSVASILIHFTETDPSLVSLGDLVTQFGTPLLIQRDVVQGRANWNRMICFNALFCADISGRHPRIDVELPVTQIDFYSPTVKPLTAGYSPWKGFVSFQSK